MTHPHDHGALRVMQDVDSQRPPAGEPDVAAAVEELTLRVAAITRRLDALVADAGAIRADVESVGGALVRLSGRRQAVRPTPAVDGATTPAADVAVQAVRLAMAWIQRAHRHPLQAGLVALEGWTLLLQETIARGHLLSSTSVDEVRATGACPLGRWLDSGEADALDPVRAAEVRSLHTEHHRMSARVLAEVRDSRVDEARRLMESEDGHIGIARRLEHAVRSWIDVVCGQPVLNAA